MGWQNCELLRNIKIVSDFLNHYELGSKENIQILNALVQSKSCEITLSELASAIKTNYDDYELSFCHKTINTFNRYFFRHYSKPIQSKYSIEQKDLVFSIPDNLNQILDEILSSEDEKYSVEYLSTYKVEELVYRAFTNLDIYSEKRFYMFTSFLILFKSDDNIDFQSVVNYCEKRFESSSKIQSFRNLLKMISDLISLEISIRKQRNSKNYLISSSVNYNELIEYLNEVVANSGYSFLSPSQLFDNGVLNFFELDDETVIISDLVDELQQRGILNENTPYFLGEKDNLLNQDFDDLNPILQKKVSILFDLINLLDLKDTDGIISILLLRIFAYYGVYKYSLHDNLHEFIISKFKKYKNSESDIFWNKALYYLIKLEEIINYQGLDESREIFIKSTIDITDLEYFSIVLAQFDISTEYKLESVLLVWRQIIDSLSNLDSELHPIATGLIIDRFLVFYQKSKDKYQRSVFSEMLSKIFVKLEQEGNFLYSVFPNIFSLFYIQPGLFVSKKQEREILRLIKGSEVNILNPTFYNSFENKLKILSPNNDEILYQEILDMFKGEISNIAFFISHNNTKHEKNAMRNKLEKETKSIFKKIGKVEFKKKLNYIDEIIEICKNEGNIFVLDQLKGLIIKLPDSYWKLKFIGDYAHITAKRDYKFDSDLLKILMNNLDDPSPRIKNFQNISLLLPDLIGKVCYALHSEKQYDELLELANSSINFIINNFHSDIPFISIHETTQRLVREILLRIVEYEFDERTGYKKYWGELV